MSGPFPPPFQPGQQPSPALSHLSIPQVASFHSNSGPSSPGRAAYSMHSSYSTSPANNAQFGSENLMLNPIAQPFRPSGGSRGASSKGGFGPPSPQVDHASLQGASIGNGKFGSPGGFIPPHILNQIQNQILPNGSRPGQSPGQGSGLMPMARPFIPQPQAQQNFPATPFQPPQSPSVRPTSTSQNLPQRFGRGLNHAGSISLPPNFIPGIQGSPMPVGPMSPVIHPSMPSHTPGPGAVSSPMSFPAPNQHPALSGRKGRKNKGLAPITPLKTSGHNSKPSISLNPAAFAAGLLAGLGGTPGAKSKKKVVVALPKEALDVEDAELLAQAEPGQEDDEEKDAGEGVDSDEMEEIKLEMNKRMIARRAALVRSRWTRREPWPTELNELVFHEDTDTLLPLPDGCTTTCPIHLQSEKGLPDSIDIYLPGQSAWDEVREMRLEEKLREIEARAGIGFNGWQDQRGGDSSVGIPWINQPEPSQGHAGGMDPTFAFGGTQPNKNKSLSISSSTDPNMVSFKLDRFLRSQEKERPEGDPNAPSQAEETSTQGGGDEELPGASFGRLGDDLPARLKEAFAKSQRKSAPNKLPVSAHGYTMSLGLPSSGAPFGPPTLSALEMIRANSDFGPAGASTETRPKIERGLSDSDIKARCETLAGMLEEEEEEPGFETADRDGEAAPAEDAKGEDAETGSEPAWKELARGFGYDLEEALVADLSQDHAASRGHSRHASRITVDSSRRGADEAYEGEDDDLRTNPSEDADASDQEEEIDSDAAEEAQRRRWARRSRDRLSDFGLARENEDYGDSCLNSEEEELGLEDSVTPSDEVFSNPSDEEAAREERRLRRERRAELRRLRNLKGVAGARPIGRPRAGTGDTLPSSSIGEQEAEHWNRGWAYPAGRDRRGNVDEIISNPSDEAQSDLDDSATFGGPLDDHGDHVRHGRTGDGLSNDFRFPRAPAQLDQASDSNNSPFSFRPPAGPSSRVSSGSNLNPGAKEFKFGGSSFTAKATSAVESAARSEIDPANPRFRLPSIQNSSFGGSSTFGEVGQLTSQSSAQPSLSAQAPSFTPGAFTFTAPGALRLPKLGSNGPLDSVEGGIEAGRDQQGREKRQRFVDGGNEEDDVDFDLPSSPPRPRASAASIEGPLRGYGPLSNGSIPPFNASAADPTGGMSRTSSTGSRFKANAPVFTPTWGRTAQRPALPSFEANEDDVTPTNKRMGFSIPESGTKALPILTPARQPVLRATSGDDKPTYGPPAAQEKRGALASMWAVKKDERTDGNSIIKQAPNGGGDVARNSTVGVPIPVPSSSIASTGSNLSSSMRRNPFLRHQPRSSRDSFTASIEGRSRKRDGYRDEADSEDDASISDFIEELAERIEKSLEGWAGRILDEVTIMGQVRPLAPGSRISGGGLDAFEKDALITSFTDKVERIIDSQISRLDKGGWKLFGASGGSIGDGDESQTTIKAIEDVSLGERSRVDSGSHSQQSRSSISPSTGLSAGMLDAHGELDFDYVQEILDVKIEALKNDLKEKFEQALASLSDRRDSETGPSSGSVAKTIEPPPDSEEVVSASAELSTTSMEKLVEMLHARIEAGRDTEERRESWNDKEEIIAALDSILETKAASLALTAQGERDRMAENFAERVRSEIQQLQLAFLDGGMSLSDQIEVTLTRSMIPHLENLRSEPVDPDVIVARVTEILAPMIEERRERHRVERRESEEKARVSFSAEDIASQTVQKVQHLVASLKSEPVNTDALVDRISAVIGKQSIEHMVDLSPVLALLEPIVSKQEDMKSLSRKIIERQQEIESTLGELPSAINAKTEIFLESTNQTHSTQASILERVEKLYEIIQTQRESSEKADQEKTRLQRELDQSREEMESIKLELADAKNKLSSAKDAGDSIKEEFQKLSGRLDQADKDVVELTDELAELRSKDKDAGEKQKAAEASLEEVQGRCLQAQREQASAEEKARLLQSHIEQLSKELDDARDQRNREREIRAQSTAEILARAEKAEKAAEEAKARYDKLCESVESDKESLQKAMERASRAEGELSSVEKRVLEQDSRLTNLLTVNASQKQKAATSMQKLSETEKKIKELERVSEDLKISEAKVRSLEAQVKEKADLENTLKLSLENEERLRSDISEYDQRFTELESDLLEMKDHYVAKDVLRASEAQLDDSKKEIEELKKRIDELVQEKVAKPGKTIHVGAGSDEWVDLERTNSGAGKGGAWNSIHAPRQGARASMDYGDAEGYDTSGTTASNSYGILSPVLTEGLNGARSFSGSTNTTTVKEIEQDEGGWWS